MGSALPHRQRHAGGADDLVGPHEALPVPGEQTLRTGRVEPCQLFAKPDAAEKPMEFARLLPDLLGNFGDRRQTVRESPEVKTGAADENGQPSRSYSSCDLVKRQRAPVGDRTAFGSIEKAVEPMRHAFFRGPVGARSQDSKITVDLLAVGIDDGSAEGIRQL